MPLSPPRSDSKGRARRPRSSARPRASTEWLYGLNAIHEALAAHRRQINRLRVREGVRSYEIETVVAAAKQLGVPIEAVPAGRLASTVPDEVNSQGVALLAGPLPELSLEELVSGAAGPTTFVALDGVEDPQNLGAIARVAEAAGVSGLILTKRRASPLTAAVARASAGAIEWLPVGRVGNLARSLEDLQRRGFWVFGASPDAPDDLYQLPARVVGGMRIVVLGSEGRGIRPGIESILDHVVRIPMGGRVGSLNVSTAAAILLFELGRRDRMANPDSIPYK